MNRRALRSSGIAAALALLLWTACADRPSGPYRDAEPRDCAGGVPLGEVPAMDVAIVVDTSMSTQYPSGLDVDEDGLVGDFRHSEITDPDDSWLALQVSAVRRLLGELMPRGVRFAIVSYAGQKDYPLEDSRNQYVPRDDGRILVELSGDPAQLDVALDRILKAGSDGNTSFAPAMKLALRAVTPDPDNTDPDPRTGPVLRRVLFLSDSPTPVRRAPDERLERLDSRMKIEAERAIEAGVPIHTFAIGDAARASPPHSLDQIAGATGGVFRAVRDAQYLHCHLLGVLVTAR